ncbi:MAG: HAMP domain-containing histidine kinase [Aestuariibacter sp.]|uniref:sensor histidine kinase n=1 Tax=Marisediminitalea aggregata TaxID=634436 RepID=UPI0020CDBBC7|nr:HAMP domain-containing sensor histidine kinase [Marisediminitalea aggregata]MCP4525349.1 HAMP domain-containing histidine kinase [Aestuariibacter sp.]MCP9477028.1 HAMP domain-containing histidine kinase [Marisediminitalea aggregata]
MKLSGIQAQLFIAFGSLVLVINLFYTRLSVLFVDVTEDIVASHLLDQEIQRLEQHWLSQKTVTALSSSAFSLSDVPSNKNWGPAAIDNNMMVSRQADDAAYFKAFVTDGLPAGGVRMQASALTPLSSFTDVFSVFLFSASAAAMILAILSTWFLASRLAKPLQALAESVKTQAPDAPCTIAGTERQDEIGTLATTFTTTYSALQDAWQRERDFTHDVSHELRTPITLLKNTLAIHPETVANDTERQLLEQATNTLQQTVEVLLALARKENLQFSAVAVMPVLERVLLAIHHVHPELIFEAELKVDDNAKVIGNAYLITLLCQNLVNNGVYHGGGKGMTISLADGQWVFENPLADTQSRPYYQGLGHGQYLVKRIASVMQWDIDFQQTEACYRVVLTPRMADDEAV